TITVSGANTYTWVASQSNSASIVVSPSTTSSYTVFGTGSAQCAGVQLVTLTVFPTPLISVSPPSSTSCAQSNLLYTATGAGTYTWNGTTTGNAVSLITPTASAVFTVSGTSANGCTGTSTISVTSHT